MGSLSKWENRGYLALSVFVGLCHVSIFLGVDIVTRVLCLLVIFGGYFLLFFYNKIYPVIILICSARVLSGFLLGVSGFGITSIIVNYLPLMFYIVRNLKFSHLKFRIKRYKFTILYSLLLLFGFLINYDIAYPLLQPQIVPQLFILLVLLFVLPRNYSFDITPLKYYFRAIFISSLIVFILPNHTEIVNNLLTDGSIFGAEADDIVLSYKDFFRNEGIFFDPRILGTFAYIYTFIILRGEKRILWMDIFLCLIVIITTISRGAFVCFVLVLLGNFHFNVRNVFGYIVLAGALATIVVVTVRKNDTVQVVLQTLDITSEDNALSQRSVFSDYSLKTFENHPIFGAGVGDLTAPGTKHRNISSTYDVVSDAFLFSLLGEMGIVGFVLFLLSMFEVVYKKCKRISLFLLIGLLLQMMGTDLPNMRLAWFAMLMIVCHDSFFSNRCQSYLSKAAIPLESAQAK